MVWTMLDSVNVCKVDRVIFWDDDLDYSFECLPDLLHIASNAAASRGRCCVGASLISCSVMRIICDATTLFLTQLVVDKPVRLRLQTTLQKVSQGTFLGAV